MTERDSSLVASSSQTVGPFFQVGPGNTERLGRMAGPGTPGDHIRLHIRVLDGDGTPVQDALIELCQADADGNHPQPLSEDTPPNAFTGFGRLGTDDEGSCRFETVRPGAHDTTDGREAGHLSVCLFARGLLRHLYTRIYFDGDPALDGDPLLSIVPIGRRSTLLASRLPDGMWEFIVRLQGDRETVFFDL